ncbi:hypothetical protein V7O66_02090 [Methanolobus sp. ZRKC3]|uniref:hypothetical protein n=1 Tax=Methanolobus sp. ZRKC3 TaxID=3125786 RepID=UPI0032474A20
MEYYNENEEDLEDGEDFWGSLIGAAAGIFLGMAGVAILDSLAGYRCPRCKNKIQKNDTMCKHCHNYLRWH